MIITEYFKTPTPPEYLCEFPKGSGLFHIPIRFVKKMLNEDFFRWGTTNFRCNILPIGHDIIVSGSVELNLEFVVFPFGNDTQQLTEVYTFTGANTLNVKTEQAEGINDNWEGTLLSNCIKNAVKNIGIKYGLELNTLESYLPTYAVKAETPKHTTKKAIANILNSQSKKIN